MNFKGGNGGEWYQNTDIGRVDRGANRGGSLELESSVASPTYPANPAPEDRAGAFASDLDLGEDGPPRPPRKEQTQARVTPNAGVITDFVNMMADPPYKAVAGEIADPPDPPPSGTKLGEDWRRFKDALADVIAKSRLHLATAGAAGRLLATRAYRSGEYEVAVRAVRAVREKTGIPYFIVESTVLWSTSELPIGCRVSYAIALDGIGRRAEENMNALAEAFPGEFGAHVTETLTMLNRSWRDFDRSLNFPAHVSCVEVPDRTGKIVTRVRFSPARALQGPLPPEEK